MDSVNIELAALLRENLDEIVHDLMAAYARLYPHSKSNSLPLEARRGRTIDEVSELADAIETGDLSNLTYKWYWGDMVDQVDRRDFRAFVMFVESRFFYAKIIMPRIWCELAYDPKKARDALSCFESFLQRVIRENFALFAEDVLVPGTFLMELDTVERLDCAQEIAEGAPTTGTEVSETPEETEHLEFGKESKYQGITEALSPRELEVLRLLGSGMTNNEIAVALDVSQNTVKHHIGHMFDKLNVGNRTELALCAVRKGLTAQQ